MVLVDALAGLSVDGHRIVPDPVQTELVLHTDGILVRQVDRPRRGLITLNIALANSPSHIRFVGAQHPRLVNRGDAARGRGISRSDGRDQIACERRNPASAGSGGGNEDYANRLTITAYGIGSMKCCPASIW